MKTKFCNKCKTTKPLTEFRWTKRSKAKSVRYRASFCTPCQDALARACAQRSQDESLQTAHRKNNLWTESDYKTLEEMTAAGESCRAIALALGRTMASVYGKRSDAKKESVE